MNQELPKPLRNALARQAGDEMHPSPDVLASFVERKLPREEQNVVTSHLAQCADCREVVFLVSSAAEDAAPERLELAAAAAPRRRWRLGLSWAVAAVAVLLVSGVLLRERFLPRPTVSTVASNSQPPGSAPLALPPTPAEPETLAKSARSEFSPPKTLPALTTEGVSPKGGEKHPPALVRAAPPAGESAQTLTVFDDKAELAAPAPVSKNAFAPNRPDATPHAVVHPVNPMMYLQPDAVPHAVVPPVNPMMPLLGASATRGQWRVSADGHLEHLGATDEWTRVLADEATTFHVVSVVGSNVWAGGSGGALFHSDDGGESWSRVAIATSSGGAETGTIVSIRFSDPLHGTVTTGGGSRWSTSDGGASWTPQ